jgi:spermidine/putrescine transport system ATP-binding protein
MKVRSLLGKPSISMAAGRYKGSFEPIGKAGVSVLASGYRPRGAQVLSLQKSAIEVRNVSKVFPGPNGSAFKALDDVSVNILENEFFTLLGPSGCGKTTLLRLIAGFDFPSDGNIFLYGEDIAMLPPFKRPVNTVFQNYALFPHMTVGQNIGFGLEMLGKPKSEISSRVDEMLRLVQMFELKDRRTSQISGGQQQRVALARALAPKPKVLLLDEPLSALDYKLRKDMQIELKRLQHETGITFIFVTHDQEEALTMSDRIAVMNKGHILQVGGPRDIYERPAERFVANFIGETNFLKGTARSSSNDKLRVDLAAGGSLYLDPVEGTLSTGDVTVIVRPENASLVSVKAGNVSGTIENIIYFGTDTHFHVKLSEGEAFVVRQQNNKTGPHVLTVGTPVGVMFEAGAAQVLKD